MTVLWLLPLLPLGVACAAALGIGGAWIRWSTVVAALASLLLGCLAAAVVARAGRVELLAGWFGLNSLASLFLLLTAALATTSAIFSLGYVRHLTRHDSAAERRYYLNFNLFVASLLAVPLMLEVALAWVAVELTTLLSYFSGRF
jgi:NADH:ubiquinone oxidoreductase subunit 5 (chain L)/Multisubunit Na+/H+ antiporter, MnhA subunit